jgi:hypothetical protein
LRLERGEREALCGVRTFQGDRGQRQLARLADDQMRQRPDGHAFFIRMHDHF